jgi:non-ribosomal peptide synthetase component F
MNDAFSVFLEWRHPDISASFASIVSEKFCQILTGILDEKTYTIRELSKITDSDKNQIMKWNTVRPSTVERCIHHVIEDQVNLHPEKEAICSWDGTFKFSELNRLSSILASHLSVLGVQPETRVALCFDKSVSRVGSESQNAADNIIFRNGISWPCWLC